MVWLHKTSRVVALAILLSISTAACVKQNQPGVGLLRFDSSAVFGAPEPKVSIPGFDTPQPFGDEFPVTDAKVSDLITPRVGPIAANPGPCPPAKLTAFPKASATVKPIGTPVEGLYRWQRALVVSKDASKTPPQTARPFALENRAIRRVTRQSDHQFSFQMVAPDPLEPDRQVITSFRVNSSPVLLAERRVPARTIGVTDIPGADVRVVDPSDAPGIFILSIVKEDTAHREVSAFRPVQPMLILPLEGGIVRTGQTFNSIGIDASTGAVLSNSGFVGRSSRIDACGEIVEGYALQLKQTLTSDVPVETLPDSAIAYATRNETREVGYVFATQYGALPISETLSIGDIEADPTGFIGKWELGGLTPTALPDSLK